MRRHRPSFGVETFADEADPDGMGRAAAVAAALAAVVLAGLGGWKAGVLEPPFLGGDSGEIDTPGVYLVALGEVPQETLEQLAAHYEARYHVPVSTLPAMPLDRSLFDPERGQVAAEYALAYLRDAHPGAAARTAVVAVTHEDMFARGKPWEHAFALRDGRYAVVSGGRMDPAFAGARSMPKLAAARLRKAVGREIGVLYLGLPLSTDRRSLVYSEPLSADDLDFMTESYTPKPYRARKREWLKAADGACGSARSATGAVRPSSEPSPAELLASASVSVSVDGDLVRRLARIEPSPSDRRRVDALLALMAQARRRDARTIAELGRSWDEAAIEQWRQASLSDVIAMRALSLQLGSEACAAYLAEST